MSLSLTRSFTFSLDKSLGTTFDSIIDYHPKSKEALELKRWYKPEFTVDEFRALSYNTYSGKEGIQAVYEANYISEAEGKTDDVVSFTGIITAIPHDRPIWYPSCPECKKKVTLDEDEGWFCQKCERMVDRVNRYVFRMCISDFSSSIWASVFEEVGEKLFGVNADELSSVKDVWLAICGFL